MNVDIDYLKKLVEVLQQADPYSNIYAGWDSTLCFLEIKLARLSEKIRKEVAKSVN